MPRRGAGAAERSRRGRGSRLRFSRVVDRLARGHAGLLCSSRSQRQKHDGARVRRARRSRAGAAGALVEHVPADCAWALRRAPLRVQRGATQRATRGERASATRTGRRSSSSVDRHGARRHGSLCARSAPDLASSASRAASARPRPRKSSPACSARDAAVLKTEGNLNSEIGLPMTVLNGLKPTHDVAVLEMAMYQRRRHSPPGASGSAAHRRGDRRPAGPPRAAGYHRAHPAGEAGARRGAAAGRRSPILNADDPRVARWRPPRAARVVRYGVARGRRRARRRHREPRAARRRVRPAARRASDATCICRCSARTACTRRWRRRRSALEEGLYADARPPRRCTSCRRRCGCWWSTGINGSRIVDDSYNASPESVLAALNLLLRAARASARSRCSATCSSWAREEETGHRRVGHSRGGWCVDLLVTFGQRSKITADEARSAGLRAEQVFEASSHEEIVELLRSGCARRRRAGQGLAGDGHERRGARHPREGEG